MLSIETTPVSAPTAYCNLKERSPGAGFCVDDALALYLLIASVTQIHNLKTNFRLFSLRKIEFGLIFTAQIFAWTIHWWHPNVRWSGVHVHNKWLWWCTNCDVKAVMNLKVGIKIRSFVIISSILSSNRVTSKLSKKELTFLSFHNSILVPLSPAASRRARVGCSTVVNGILFYSNENWEFTHFSFNKQWLEKLNRMDLPYEILLIDGTISYYQCDSNTKINHKSIHGEHNHGMNWFRISHCTKRKSWAN